MSWCVGSSCSVSAKLWLLRFCSIYVYAMNYVIYPGVDSAFNRNEYQENFLGVNAASA